MTTPMTVAEQNDLRLYDQLNLNACPWPETPDGRYAQAFLTPLIKNGVSQYIENVKTDLQVLLVDDLVLPVTINETEYQNSYVCSPYSYYISYAQESLDIISQAWLGHLMNQVLNGLGKALQKFRFNKVVLVNNWFFSTNLYPQISPLQVKRIAEYLQAKFPEHAIIFRSLDPHTNPVCYQTLQPMNCAYIATRQIFLLDTPNSTFSDSRLFKSDMKLLKNSGYQIVGSDQLSEKDIPRLLDLYRDLYIHKYSSLNPQFNHHFLQLTLTQNLLNFRALIKDGRIDGVVGFVERHGKMYCPFFGYDRQVPKDPSLYRLLSTVLMQEAHQRQLLFHQSSGASMFKTIRKAQGCIEYTAVFYKHLKIRRHIPWLMLKNLYNSIGLFYMKRY